MIRVFIFLSLLASFFAMPAQAQQSLPQADFSELRFMGTGRISQIVDPQTVQLQDGMIIALTGLDFPDLSVNDAGDLSVTAVKILNDMLLGKEVNIYQTKSEDSGLINRMGHKIGHLERKSDGAWVQGVLVSLGLARVRTTGRNPEMAGQLYTLEQQARAAKLGLWANNDYKVLTPDEASQHIGSFAIIEGTVVSASMNKNRIFLNFGSDWRSDFSVSIPPEDRRAFSRANIDPLQWNGKTIRVRGWLESYNGPNIEIDHPQAIELPDMKDLPQAVQSPMLKNITAKP